MRRTANSPVHAVVGVDTGGTFTDLLLRLIDGETGATVLTNTHKLLSTPDDPGKAVMEGLLHLLESSDVAPHTCPVVVVHGSTVATNALLERRGVKTALVTSQGFEDMLAIGRQSRRDLYDLKPQAGEPLISADGSFGAPERISATGDVLAPLSDASIDRIVKEVVEYGATSVAVCLLFSFLGRGHEKRLANKLRQAGLFVSASHEILPEHREYERASTTAINAYVSPLMQRYLSRLSGEMEKAGIARMHVMQSAGGTISPEKAGAHGVQTLLSGPAGGVVGALTAASQAGNPHIITFDMGGTSTDVGLVPGKLQTTTESMIDGMPVRIPLLDIQTVGAGGGSIATLDAGGALVVGPKSAGAVPGPACYGLGGKEPTVTDAHVVLGRLPVDSFLGGRMPLDPELATEAIQSLAARLNASIEETARGIIHIANTQMERALRLISVERGFDPGQFTFVSYGGAGGLHAVELARALGISKVLCPAYPGVFSAWGMAVADVVKTASQGIIGPLEGVVPEAASVLSRLTLEAIDDLRHEARFDGVIHLEPSVDLRYRGQSFEIEIPLPAVSWRVNGPAGVDEIRLDAEALHHAFSDAHERLYGHRSDEAIELVAVRLRATCRGVPPEGRAEPSTGDRTRLPATGDVELSTSDSVGFTPVTRAWIGDGWYDAPIIGRHSLDVGVIYTGPAIVTEDHATTIIGPTDRMHIDPHGHLIIRLD